MVTVGGCHGVLDGPKSMHGTLPHGRFHLSLPLGGEIGSATGARPALPSGLAAAALIGRWALKAPEGSAPVCSSDVQTEFGQRSLPLGAEATTADVAQPLPQAHVLTFDFLDMALRNVEVALPRTEGSCGRQSPVEGALTCRQLRVLIRRSGRPWQFETQTLKKEPLLGVKVIDTRALGLKPFPRC